ncbi:MAG: hypothetical protein C4536_04310 [Actinobacteria bacterium]|jgi:predicted amidohydrolase YtcJ|nr:MAG: hypothetical protein C4536_04310 [Actinomycetota bacterium]
MSGRLLSRWTGPRYDGQGSRPADLAVVNAKVFTCNSGKPWAEAVAVKDGRITYVGDDRGAADFIGPGTEVIDAAGRVLTPGFVDNHCHVLWVGGTQALSTRELYDARSVEELASIMHKQAADFPELPIVMGLGFMYDYMPGGKPDKELMDSIIPDRPAMIGAYSGQTICANTPAMKLLLERNPAAFQRLIPEVDRKTGRYTGFLLHAHSFSLLDYFTLDELGSGAREAIMGSITAVLDEALSVGVTTMQDAQLYRPFIPLLLEFRRRGGMDRVRLRGTFYVSPYSLEDEDALREDLDWWMETGRAESDEHFVLGDAVKLYIDGVSTSHTAFMLEPYSDTEDERGDAVWSDEGFKRVMEIVDGAGLQACTHCCGDAGARRVVDGYVHAVEVNGARDARHRVDHCELPLPGERERMAAAGIYAAMQPTHFYGDETTEKVLGPERLQRYMPWRSLERDGVELSFGSDWCAGPINPVYGLLIAATRFNFRGKMDWGPGEKVDLEGGVRHWTIDSARALRMEEEIGSLQVGKYGDMVLFNTSPFKLDSFWFLLTHELDLGAMDDFVDLTVVGGKVVFRKKS